MIQRLRLLVGDSSISAWSSATTSVELEAAMSLLRLLPRVVCFLLATELSISGGGGMGNMVSGWTAESS